MTSVKTLELNGPVKMDNFAFKTGKTQGNCCSTLKRYSMGIRWNITLILIQISVATEWSGIRDKQLDEVVRGFQQWHEVTEVLNAQDTLTQIKSAVWNLRPSGGMFLLILLCLPTSMIFGSCGKAAGRSGAMKWDILAQFTSCSRRKSSPSNLFNLLCSWILEHTCGSEGSGSAF